MTKRYMPLSLAIREGCKKVAGARGTYSRDRKSAKGYEFEDSADRKPVVACALGTAYWGANGKPDGAVRLDRFADIGLDDRLAELCGPIVAVNVEHPVSKTFRGTMLDAIESLFESHGWTRQMCADFVSTYEDAGL